MKKITAPKSTPTQIKIMLAMVAAEGPMSIREIKAATGTKSGEAAVYAALQGLKAQERVIVAGKVQTGMRGKPPHTFALTKNKGVPAAKRALKNVQKAA